MVKLSHKVPQDGNWMYVITPDLPLIPLGTELNTVPDLALLKKGLDGGLLEIVPRLNTFFGRKCIAFCDEEGKMKGLQYNIIAHRIWEDSVGRSITEDYLVGPIIGYSWSPVVFGAPLGTLP